MSLNLNAESLRNNYIFILAEMGAIDNWPTLPRLKEKEVKKTAKSELKIFVAKKFFFFFFDNDHHLLTAVKRNKGW